MLFIIGLTAGIVTLTLPQRPTTEQASAQAFARILTETQEQAIFAGQPVGIKLSPRGYSILQWRRDGWRPTGQVERLPRGLDIAVTNERAERPDVWPDLVFDPTGIVEPTAFELQGRGIRIEIELVETGEVILVER